MSKTINSSVVIGERENELSEKLIQERPSFALNQPMKVTVKSSDGRYSKVPLIGGEGFVGQSCYMGKRGKLIFCFVPDESTVIGGDWSSMEMDIDAARRTLDGFEAYLDDFVGSSIQETIKEARAEAQRRETAAYAEVKKEVYGDAFGSW